jgi:hypothetical protein
MKLLDKLRPQPKIKHADPAVRLEGLQDIDDADQVTLIQLATDDPDARVRRAASGRLTDTAALAAIVRNESDASARDHALSRLVSLAEQSDERAGLSAVTALAALGRQRELANTARVSRFESVRRSAVEQVTDQKALGGIARHAADAGIRLLATGRITDLAELEAIAARGEHADAAVDALDRLAAPSDDTLNGLIQRARTKAVQKRARTLLRAREEAARPVEPAAAPELKEADQQRARELGDQMEAIASASDISSVRETYAALRVAWVELLADADVRADLTDRFEQLSDRVREQLAAYDAARAEAERQAQAAGLEVETVSAGGTPTMWASGELRPTVTEYRVGTYAFHDRATVAAGAAAADEVALTVRATVVSRPSAERAVLDAGSKVLTHDPCSEPGFGTILGAPASVVEWLSEEHAVVAVAPGDTLELGQQVRIVPNHVCVVVNVADELVVHGEGLEPTTWPVDARGRSR